MHFIAISLKTKYKYLRDEKFGLVSRKLDKLSAPSPAPCCVRPSHDFELFLKTDIRHIVLDQKKNSKNILEKAFFYIFSGFFLNYGFVSMAPLRGEILLLK